MIVRNIDTSDVLTDATVGTFTGYYVENMEKRLLSGDFDEMAIGNKVKQKYYAEFSKKVHRCSNLKNSSYL